MKRLIYFLCFILIFSLAATGCNITDNTNAKQNSSGSEKAASYLKDKGYVIVFSKGKVSEYVLKNKDLNKLPYQQYWAVQKNEASDYLNKTIETYYFIIKNHPLDNFRGNNKKQTRVWVMVSENKVIGGYSLPDLDLAGGVYSIDGKTLEEITGVTYQEWLKEWVKKYD